MPIIDPGITTINEDGSPILSPQAIRIPPPRLINDINPNMNMPGGITPNIPSPQLNAPTPIMQGQQNLPKYSIPSDRYAETVSQQPRRDDPRFEHHGMRKLLDVLGAIQSGPKHGYVQSYEALKNQPYNTAMEDWQNKLAALRPEVQFQEAETRERGEGERSAAQLASVDASRRATEAHQHATEDLTEQQRAETERKDEAAENLRRVQLKQEKDRAELDRKFREQKEKLEKQHQDELERHNREIENIQNKKADKATSNEAKGTWELYTDPTTGKITQQYNAKLGQFRPFQGEAPNVVKPAEYAKKQAKLAPVRAANEFAQNYLKSGKFDGPHDEALLEKYFELAKPSSGFRMTEAQMNLLLKARGIIEGLKAKGQHLAGGTYFDNAQRRQIVQTMKDLALAEDPSSGNTNNEPIVTNPDAPKINHRRPVE